MGKIPRHWSVTRVAEQAHLVNGYPFGSELFHLSEGIPLVRIRDLGREQAEVFFSGSALPAAQIDSGDILIGMDGDFNVAEWRGGSALLNQRLCCLRPRPTIDRRFLLYSLPFPLQVNNDLTYSTTVKHLSSVDVRKIRLAFPPPAEQQAIANFLDRKTEKIDALVAKKERLIGLLEEKRAALITQAVTGGLDPNVPTKDSGVEWLGKMPVHWKTARLKRVSELQTGITLGKRHESGTLESRPYLRVANVQDGYLDLGELAEIALPSSEIARYELHPGDVVVTEGGDFDKLGRGHLWEGQIPGCLHQNHIFAIRPRLRALNPRFLAHVTASAYGRGYFTATSVQSTNLACTNSTKLGEFPLPLPDPGEQDAIVGAIEEKTSKLDGLSSKVREAIAKLREYRTALVSAAVTGKIDVRGKATPR